MLTKKEVKETLRSSLRKGNEAYDEAISKAREIRGTNAKEAWKTYRETIAKIVKEVGNVSGKIQKGG